MIYHITKEQTWEMAIAKNLYDYCALNTEGFIHASTREQVIETANRFFKNESDLILLKIDENKLKSELKFEASDQGDNVLFPHIYGPLNIDAVVDIGKIDQNERGEFVRIRES